MRKKLLIELGLVAALVIVGIVVYFVAAPTTVANLAPMSRLVITNPEIANITPKPTYSAPTSAHSSGLAILQQAYRVSPGETGAYTSQWFGVGAKGGNVGIFTELLPTKALATQAAQTQVATNMTALVLAAQKYTLKSTFTIPGVAGSSGVYYLIPVPAKKNAAGVSVPQPSLAGYTAEIQVGRVATRINFTGVAATKAAVVSIAKREAVVMKSGLVGFKNMASTDYPIGPALWILLAVLVLSGLVFFVPFARARYEAAQLAREEARRRYQLQSRGAKVVRRKGVRR
jgi:hypothetical protein